jgi:small subunit ribosomal protein S3
LGHKVHPYGFRIGVIKPWLAKWYADRDYATLLQEDMRIRELVARQLSNASVSQVEIERGINHVTVTVHTAKPGIVIGKGGANVEALRTNIGKLTDKKVKLEIKEILQPELDGMLLAQNVAGQLERRIAFRKAIKQSIQRTIKAGAKGVKIQVSGRLGGSEMSRTEWDKEGRIPLGTLRADISYGVVHAHTTYGRIGVKAWVYRGEQLGDRPGSARTEPRAARRPAAPTRTRAPRAGAVEEPVTAEATEATAATAAAAPVEAPPAAVEAPMPAQPTAAADPTVPEAAAAAPAAEAPAAEASTEATATDAASAEGTAEAPAEPAAEKPARKPRASRASAATKAASGEQKAASGETKPTRTRKAAPKKAAADADAAPKADAASEGPAEASGEEG